MLELGVWECGSVTDPVGNISFSHWISAERAENPFQPRLPWMRLGFADPGSE